MCNKLDNLKSLGERSIIDNILISIFPDIIQQYDDCATVRINASVLQISTDPCPEPIAFELGYLDFYYYGWLTAVVNLSDLAAMGATPIGILVSTIMKENMAINDYERFLIGLKDACNRWECPLLGGNIKDGEKFSATGFALGINKDNVLRQNSARDGDIICVLGEMGMFWSSVLYEKAKESIIVSKSDREKLFNALTKPEAKLFEAVAMAKTNYVSSCTDNSDGITWSLIDLARKSKVDFVLTSDKIKPNALVKKIAEETGCDTINLMLSGGDYQLVFTVPPEHFDDIKIIADKYNTVLCKIGYVKSGEGKALVEKDDKLYKLNDIASERFNNNSLFTHGYKSYINVLKGNNIIGDEYIEGNIQYIIRL